MQPQEKPPDKPTQHCLWQVKMCVINDGDFFREMQEHLLRLANGGCKTGKIQTRAYTVQSALLDAARRGCHDAEVTISLTQATLDALMQAWLVYFDQPSDIDNPVDSIHDSYDPYQYERGDAKPQPKTETLYFNPPEQGNTEPENDMNQIKITTQTLVNGADISRMPDEEIYTLIANQETKIAELNMIKNKPILLQAEIAKRQAGVDALVAHLDSKVTDEMRATLAASKPAKASKG
jgi:hypothetical protein